MESQCSWNWNNMELCRHAKIMLPLIILYSSCTRYDHCSNTLLFIYHHLHCCLKTWSISNFPWHTPLWARMAFRHHTKWHMTTCNLCKSFTALYNYIIYIIRQVDGLTVLMWQCFLLLVEAAHIIIIICISPLLVVAINFWYNICMMLVKSTNAPVCAW